MGQDAATAVLGGKGGFAVPAPPAWIGVENPAAPAGVNSPATAADNPSPGSSEEEGPAASTGEVDWQHIRESWSRAIRKARLLGKGCCNVPKENCIFLLPAHWLEVFDEHHRCHLKTYFKRWLVASTKMNFYDWLDRGEGNSLDLEERPRHVLSKQHVHYCTEQERSYLEVVVGPDGLLRYKVGGDLVDTGSEAMYEPPSGDESTGLSNDDEGGDAGEGEEQGTEQGEDEREEDEQEELAALRIESEACSDMVSPSPRHQKVRWICMEGTEEKQVASSVDIRDNGDDEDPSNPENNRWIYVLDMDNRLFINKKIPGKFHHSSMSLGRPLLGAGSISVAEGQVSIVTAWSGHYRPSHEAFSYVINYLRARGVDMRQVKQYFSKLDAGLKKTKSARPLPSGETSPRSQWSKASSITGDWPA